MSTFQIYLLVGFSLLAFELFIPTFFFLFSLGISSIVVAGLNYLFVLTDWISILLVAIITPIILYRSRKMKITQTTKRHFNLDKYIGKEVRVEKVIEPGRAQIRVFGESWVGKYNFEIKDTDILIISKIEGNIFTLERKK